MRPVSSILWILVLLLPLTGCDQKKEAPAVPPPPAQTPATAAPAGGTDTVTGIRADTSLTADTLYQLLAPIALFPDRLLAQTLAASTTPDDVAAANTWLMQNKALTGATLAKAVNSQPWPPAVKALTTFPDVLNQMAQSLPWTRALGDAYTQSPTDVMNAVQVLRQRAANNGTLKSSPQQQVIIQPDTRNAVESDDAATPVTATKIIRQPPQTIIIQPTQPGVVYVPGYSPAVYGNPPVVYYPGYVPPPPAYSTGDMVATGLISFTAGIMVGAMINDNWGWNCWNTHWGGSPVVVYNNRTFVSHTVVDRNRIDWQRNTFAPGPVRTPHFAASRNTFTPVHAPTFNGQHAGTPTFDPRRNAPQYVPRNISPHMPPPRTEHNLPRHEERFPPQRVMAPGPVRLSPERQQTIERAQRQFHDTERLQRPQTTVSPFRQSTHILQSEPEHSLTSRHHLDAVTHLHRF